MSPELQQKLNQWVMTASVTLTHLEKKELNRIYKAKFGKSLNLSCSSCLVNAMNKLAKDQQPKIENVEISQNSIDHKSMKIADLRDLCKQRGLPIRGKKSEIIERLKG